MYAGGSPGLEWAFQALCLSSWPHRDRSLPPGFSTPHGSRISREGKPGPQDHLSPLGWKPTQKPPHPPTPISQATGRRRGGGGQGHKTQSRLARPSLLSSFHLDLGLRRQGSQFPSQELAPRKTHLHFGSSLLLLPSSPLLPACLPAPVTFRLYFLPTASPARSLISKI